MASFKPSSFDSILASFKSRLSSEHTELFQLATFDDLKASIKMIQTEQAARKGLRNLNKIKPFLRGLEQYAGILEVFIQAKPEILAFIWGPIKLCLQIASKLNEAFDALLDAYERIGNSLPILSNVDTLFCSHPHVKQVLADIFEDILDFHKRAIVFFKHGTWKLTFKLTHHTFSDMFGDILKKLDRSRDLILQSANVAHFQESQEARIHFTKEMKVLLDEQQNQRRIAVMDWLSSETNSAIQHQELQKIRAILPQTTRWIFSQPQMLDWLKSTDYTPRTFWLCGIPGAGKTVLFSSVVDEISATLPDAQVVYFYCKNNDPLRSHFIDIAKSLISQLLQINPNFLDFIYESMLTGGERRAKDPAKLLQIIGKILTNHDSLFIGIDGLDECPEEERKLFLDLITIVSRAEDDHGYARIIVTSRQEKDLEKSLKTAAKFNIKPQNLENDMTAYIKFKMAELSQTFQFTQEREQLISKEICTRPMGMFLLARLIMDNLLSQDSLEDLNEELRFEVLPHGINEAYGRMLVRIGKSTSMNPNQLQKRLQRAKLVLTLVTTSKRALYTHEIQGALATNLDKQNVDFENRHSRFPLDDLCGPIIQVHQNGIVDLIHPTAKEYLWQHHSGYYIKSSDAKEFMATLCTSYLAFDCFSPGYPKDKFATSVLSGDLAFQEYAACNWFKHLDSLLGTTEIEIKIPKSLQKAILILQERQRSHSACSWEFKSGRLCRVDFCRVLSQIQQLYDQTDTILAEDSGTQEQLPYLLGQIYHSRSVIEGQAIQGMEQDKLKFYGKTPFRCPLLRCPYFVTGFGTHNERERHCKGHRRSFMCPHDTCDYSILGLPSDSALKTHLRLCHEDLPQTPVFPDIKIRTLEQALEDAVAANNLLAITALATELTSFPERKTGFVLQALTLGYRKAALKLLDLLGTPSEINHVHKNNTAILKTCEIGDEELFDILVKKGADINTTVGEGALTIASQNSHVSIARKLLDDKNHRRSLSHASYTNVGALAMASKYGHLEAVTLLLEKDSDHFAKKQKNGATRDFDRALNAAIKERKISCARLLLDWALGKDPLILPTKLLKLSKESTDYMISFLYREQIKFIQEDGGTKGNLLQAAARKGDYEEILHLLDLGADIDNCSGSQRNSMTPMIAATKHGRLEVVRLLLERGAYIDNYAGSDGTSMIAAAKHGRLEVVRLLLERGADIKRKHDHEHGTWGSAIDGAAAGGHEAVVRELLEKGGGFMHESIHLLPGIYKWQTSLQALSRRENSAALARLLLESGVDVNAVATGGFGESRRPLQLAVEHGEIATLEVLLEYGADVNAKNEGRTALHIAVVAGNPEKLGTLLDHGADINAVNNNGQTALIMGATCSWEDHRQVIHILLERGADIEIADKDGNTALMFAAKHPDQPLERIQILVERGANRFTKNLEGLTALMAAAGRGNFLAVEYLLQGRTNQDMEGNNEVWSAVKSATQSGQVKTARVLLKSLTKTALRDNQDLLSTALLTESSKMRPNADMISLLAEYGASVVSPAQEWSISNEFRDQTALVWGYQGDQQLFYPDQDFQDDLQMALLWRGKTKG